MPPMATKGFFVTLRACRTPSSPITGSGLAFDPVANTGPIAMQSIGSVSASRSWARLWVEKPMRGFFSTTLSLGISEDGEGFDAKGWDTHDFFSPTLSLGISEDWSGFAAKGWGTHDL